MRATLTFSASCIPVMQYADNGAAFTPLYYIELQLTFSLPPLAPLFQIPTLLVPSNSKVPDDVTSSPASWSILGGGCSIDWILLEDV
jgi:hypothetical protein